MILGCTEIPLLVRPGDTSLPLFDTALIHSEAIYRKMTQSWARLDADDCVSRASR